MRVFKQTADSRLRNEKVHQFLRITRGVMLMSYDTQYKIRSPRKKGGGHPHRSTCAYTIYYGGNASIDLTRNNNSLVCIRILRRLVDKDWASITGTNLNH